MQIWAGKLLPQIWALLASAILMPPGVALLEMIYLTTNLLFFFPSQIALPNQFNVSDQDRTVGFDKKE